jgi:hypothetical protein
MEPMRFSHWVMAAERPDLLAIAVESIIETPLALFAQIFDNSVGGWLGRSRSWPIRVHRPPVPLSWAQSMNYFQRNAIESDLDFWSYQHGDAQVQPGTVDKFLAKVTAAVEARMRWCTVFTHYDWLSAYEPRAVDDVGGWDWLFPDPNYNCDQDFFHRARRKGYALLESGGDITHLDGGSTTIRASVLRHRINGLKIPMNDAYYRAKWGGPPGKETFEKPWVGRAPDPAV